MQTSSGKVMYPVSRDRKGISLMDFVEPGSTVGSDLLCSVDQAKGQRGRTLFATQQCRPTQVLKTKECEFGSTVLPRLPHVDLALSDFHLSEPSKDELCRQRLPDFYIAMKKRLALTGLTNG